MRIRLIQLVERVLLVAGVSLLVIYGAALVHRTVSSRQALKRFDTAVHVAGSAAPDLIEIPPPNEVNFSLWSKKRVREYRESLRLKKDWPMAVLRIQRLGIRVPVFEGTDDLTLNRGVGWIPGTTRPGRMGNVAMAGHRDGFFRAFKGISLGDAVELATAEGSLLYAVDEVEIVTPDDVSVLKPRAKPSVTLVTCYPFYFIGDAPQRFIVHASLRQQPVRELQHDVSSVRAIQLNDKEKRK
jgi:sortase A